MEIMVSTDEQTPNASQRQLHPTSTIEISVLGYRVAATGRARSLEDATGAADVAQTYSPQGQPPIETPPVQPPPPLPPVPPPIPLPPIIVGQRIEPGTYTLLRA